MELPVVIEPLADGTGFGAHLAPFRLSVTGATADEAIRELAALLERRLQQGFELRRISVPVSGGTEPASGWLPDDDLTRSWLELMQQYRAECDAADRARLDSVPEREEAPS